MEGAGGLDDVHIVIRKYLALAPVKFKRIVSLEVVLCTVFLYCYPGCCCILLDMYSLHFLILLVMSCHDRVLLEQYVTHRAFLKIATRQLKRY